MHSEVNLVLSLGLLFLTHVCFVLVVDKVYDRSPGVAIIHIVTETRAVNDRELGLELFFLELRFDNLHLCELVELLMVATRIVLRRRQLS